MKIQEALSKKTWAVLGATDKIDKFGYRIFKHLKSHGYNVYPINPRLAEIDEEPCYTSIKDLPNKPDVVVFVVPESIGLQTVSECKELGISTIWLQPGADKPAVVQKGNLLGLQVIQACVLVEIK